MYYTCSEPLKYITIYCGWAFNRFCPINHNIVFSNNQYHVVCVLINNHDKYVIIMKYHHN